MISQPQMSHKELRAFDKNQIDSIQ